MLSLLLPSIEVSTGALVLLAVRTADSETDVSFIQTEFEPVASTSVSYRGDSCARWVQRCL